MFRPWALRHTLFDFWNGKVLIHNSASLQFLTFSTISSSPSKKILEPWGEEVWHRLPVRAHLLLNVLVSLFEVGSLPHTGALYYIPWIVYWERTLRGSIYLPLLPGCRCEQLLKVFSALISLPWWTDYPGTWAKRKPSFIEWLFFRYIDMETRKKLIH